jgi:hypothetical protein
LAFVFVVTLGRQASTLSTVGVGVGVSETDALPVNVGVGVSVSIVDGGSVAAAPDGRLQASAARLMKSTDNKTFLFLASITVLL